MEEMAKTTEAELQLWQMEQKVKALTKIATDAKIEIFALTIKVGKLENKREEKKSWNAEKAALMQQLQRLQDLSRLLILKQQEKWGAGYDPACEGADDELEKYKEEIREEFDEDYEEKLSIEVQRVQDECHEELEELRAHYRQLVEARNEWFSLETTLWKESHNP